jgi:hypothetical protein
MSYQTGYYDAPPRRRVNRLLLRLTIFVWLLVFGCVGLRAFVQPALNDFFIRRVLQASNPGIELPANVTPREAVRTAVSQLPLPAVPKLPTGTFTITDDQATGYLAANRAQLGVDNIQVRFVPNEVEAVISVGPISGTARAQARAENGRVVLDNARIDGLLGSAIKIDALVDALENRLNQEVQSQRRSVTEIDVQQGQAVVTIE